MEYLSCSECGTDTLKQMFIPCEICSKSLCFRCAEKVFCNSCFESINSDNCTICDEMVQKTVTCTECASRTCKSCSINSICITCCSTKKCSTRKCRQKVFDIFSCGNCGRLTCACRAHSSVSVCDLYGCYNKLCHTCSLKGNICKKHKTGCKDCDGRRKRFVVCCQLCPVIYCSHVKMNMSPEHKDICRSHRINVCQNFGTHWSYPIPEYQCRKCTNYCCKQCDSYKVQGVEGLYCQEHVKLCFKCYSYTVDSVNINWNGKRRVCMSCYNECVKPLYYLILAVQKRPDIVPPSKDIKHLILHHLLS